VGKVLAFAYDGAVNGDWVSHYAVQLAAARPEPVLTLVHVRGLRTAAGDLEQKLERLRRECEGQGVQLDMRLPLLGRSLFDTIRGVIPPGAEHFLICGTRTEARGRGLLRRTVSEQLLRSGHCNVLAVRVVQPGLLGSPRRLLLPVAARPAGLRAGLPFLRLFAPQVSHLHILLVAQVARGRLPRLTHAVREGLRAAGQTYCDRVERQLADELGLGSRVTEAQVVVSDQIAREILVAAHRSHSRLIYMGATERGPVQRVLGGDLIQQVLREAGCDVAIYRGVLP
jgi:nucleotide-binding universal stress UspA family protein